MGNIFSQRGSTITHEKENFTRFGEAIVGIGTKILQETLQTYIPSQDIANKVTSASHPNLWRRLNSQQRLLIIQAATDGYKDFDITLCYTLLRNLNVGASAPFSAPFPKPTRGWGNQPLATDTTQSDDIERIRILRNEMYGHLARPYIPTVQFTVTWNQLRDVCARMKYNNPSGTDFLKELRSLESCKVTRVQWDRILELIEQSREHEKAIEDHSKRIESLENHQITIDHNLQTVQARNTAVENKTYCHDTQIAALDTIVLSHGTTIDEHGEKLEEHSAQLEEHGTQLEEHGTQLEEHVAQLEEHGAQLEEHGAQLEEHGRQLGTLASQSQNQQAQIVNIKEQLKTDKQKRDQKIKQIRQEVLNPRADNLTDGRVDVTKLKQELLRVNEEATRNISISPLQEGDDKVPIELLYASVVIREDPKYEERENSSQTRRELTNPDDIFKKDGKITKTIYMLGDAAHGKTTYCLWLAKKWCNAQQRKCKEIQVLDMWEKALLEFDFVFLLKFRYVNPNRASVIDMICQDTLSMEKDCHDTVRHVLSSDKYRSLIIMDGLDEWNPNDESRKQLTYQAMPNPNEESRKQLTYQAMPNICVSSTVSCFFTMRPWVFASISKMVKMSDKVIEIHGLSENGIEKVVDNVLLNHYILKEDIEKFKSTKENMAKYLNMKNVKSFMKIPLLAVVCVQIWFKGKQVGDSMTSFYASMLDMLIERASEKHKHQLSQNNDNTAYCELSKLLSEYRNIQNCIYVLLMIGKVAYEGLISNETNIVFQKRELEKEIGVQELQFALDVGLISQKEAPSLLTKNVSLHFFHKSIQEFLAVIYIVTKKEVGESFCKHLSSVKVIMELSNVIMFICGMCPSLGSVISHHVVSVTDNDKKICEYRESPDNNITVRELYKQQVSWYRELQDRRIDNPVTFHISDVYWPSGDIETVSVTKELLSDPLVDIRSLNLQYAPIDIELGVTGTQRIDFLSNKYNNTRSLVMVCIYNGGINLFVPPLCIPSLKFFHLTNVEINNTHLDGNVCPPLLSNMPLLRVLKIEHVTLGIVGLDLSGMPSLQVLKLHYIHHCEIGLDISDMPSLKVLSLQNVNLHGRGLELSCMPTLQVLELHRITLSERGLDLSDMTSLHELKLVHMTLGDRGLDLSNMTSLHELKLINITLGDRGLDLSDVTSLHVLELWRVTLGDKGLNVSDKTSLHKLCLSLMTLGDRGLNLSTNMIHIEEVMLLDVEMSATRWQQFLISVLNIQHRFTVELKNTNIDDESMTMIRSSPDFKVTKDGTFKKWLLIRDLLNRDAYQLHFTRVWPPSHV